MRIAVAISDEKLLKVCGNYSGERRIAVRRRLARTSGTRACVQLAAVAAESLAEV